MDIYILCCAKSYAKTLSLSNGGANPRSGPKAGKHVFVPEIDWGR
jgi:hypothetical protein